MVVRQVLAPTPAAGQDWSFTVPAQWLPYLYGVTATLTTATPLTSVPDESGNGNNAPIQNTTQYLVGQTGPFAGGANNVSIFGKVPRTGNAIWYAQSPASAAFITANFTLEQWVKIPSGPITFFGGIFAQFDTGGNADRFGASVLTGSADPWTFQADQSGAQSYQIANFMARNAWHLLACTYDGVSIRAYIDGVLQNTHAIALPAPGVAGRMNMGGGAIDGSAAGNAAGAAYYGATLAAANLLNHFNAASSWAAYKTAALVDTPTGLWRIGQLPAGANRIVTLKVTDGTRVVGQFPASFAAATSDSFTWSWQVLGPGAQASTDGKVNSVPIPELQVDAGYVISSSTLDLAGTDRWGPITLWFDDGTGPAGGGITGDSGYLNALLVPDYSHQGG